MVEHGGGGPEQPADDEAAQERVRVLRRVLEEEPADEEARASLMELAEQGIESAAEALRPQARRAPEDAAARAKRDRLVGELMVECEAFEKVGLLPQAIEHLKAILEMDPRHEQARARLAELVSQVDGGKRRGDETLKVPTT